MAAKKKKVTKKVTKKAAKKKVTKKAPEVPGRRSKRVGITARRDLSKNDTFPAGLRNAHAALAKNAKGGEWRVTQAAEEFSKRQIYTGLVELDLNIRPAMGTRLEIIGAEHAGKSLISYVLAGAFQRTCRLCMTPILTFIDDLGDGGQTRTCGCGANDSCTVLYIDAEGDFDPLWAQAWGFKLTDKIDMHDPLEDYDEVEDGLRISPDSKVALARIQSLDQLEVVIMHLIKSGAADLIVLDSVALTTTDEDLAGKKQAASKARVLSRLYPKLISAQVSSWFNDNILPTFIQTNQWRANIQSGPAAFGPTQQATGGKALRYALTQGMEIRTRYNPWDGGFREPVAMAEMNFTMKKDKSSGGSTQASAQARLFLKDCTFDRIDYVAGESDEGPRLFELLRALADGAWGLDPDPRWFSKTSRGYEVLGRTFTTAAGIKAFLSRPDIGYRLRYPLFLASLPDVFKGHINAENYLYSPYPDDVLTELTHEARERVLGRTKSAAPAAPDTEEDPHGDL